jgi:transposase
VTEQRYKAVLAVSAQGRTVTEVARDLGVSRQTMHIWPARYEEEGLEGLSNRSHRPAQSPHQMPAVWEAKVLETRRAKPYWGARRLALELTRKGSAELLLSESAVYRCLVRAGVIKPQQRRWRREIWKRWERAAPMELWQLDTVGGFLLADGTTAKALTGVDDHSRYCVSARLMAINSVGGSSDPTLRSNVWRWKSTCRTSASTQSSPSTRSWEPSCATRWFSADLSSRVLNDTLRTCQSA